MAPGIAAQRPPPPEDPEPLDYVRLVDEEHEHRRSRRRRGAD